MDTPITIASWNVNSLNVRLPHLEQWLKSAAPDIVALQETKLEDGRFPDDALAALGYRSVFCGQKTYNGVAILSKHRPDEIVRGLPGEDADAPKRVLGAAIDDVLLLNLYVVNGEAVGTEKYAFKLDWMARLAAFVRERYDLREKVVLCGDFNVTFDDRDVHDPVLWHEKILCSTPERAALAELMRPGLIDAFRHFEPEDGHYTWWDFRTRGFERGLGLRIDHFLVSEPALAACRGVVIDRSARGGEKPSDHAPVIATID
jgi:exodeoxyribonuclease-3